MSQDVNGFLYILPKHQKGLDAPVFAQAVADYLFHLLDEFGEPDQSYTFHLVQDQELSYKLIYEEGNKNPIDAV